MISTSSEQYNWSIHQKLVWYMRKDGIIQTLRRLIHTIWTTYFSPTHINQYLNKTISPNIGLFHRIYFYFDVILCNVIYGSSIFDYFLFHYYDLNHRGRKQFATERTMLKIESKLNNSQDGILLYDKRLFCRSFVDYLHRDWIDLSETSFDSYIAFVSLHPKYIVKPYDGNSGHGIYIETASSDILELKKSY